MDEFSTRIADILQSGKLVDDQIVVDIMKNLQQKPDEFMNGAFADAGGLILDGVPRTVKQAEKMAEFMEVDMILNFFNIDEIVIAKIMGRRVCPVCNKNFNVTDIDFAGYRMPPLLPSHGNPEFCDDPSHKE